MTTSKLNPTQKLLVKMLTENTGIHFLDSGMDNGRMWQRNQGKTFISEPRVTAEFYEGDDTPNITVSTFHYLSDVLELDDYAKTVNRFFVRQRNKDIDAHWIGECDELLENKDEITWCGEQWNTYNHENNLSQILQGRIFRNMYNEVYVLLQIHGGADVRGGYTDTQCFKLNGYLTGNANVYGSNDKGEQVENRYNGYSLTTEDGEDITMFESDNWSFDFEVIDDTYMYEY